MDAIALKSLTEKALESVNKTLSCHNEAMKNLLRQYRLDSFSRMNLASSLEIMFQTRLRQGKIVLCGIGKSFKIANKLVATLHSLSIDSSILHPSEALHGDLGLLHDRDCMVLLTASGNTPELIQLLPHISKNIPIILLTCNKESKLSQHTQIKSLLYVELPEHLNEDTIHGIPAPTVSATLSLTLADATILALSEMIEDDLLKRKKLFSMKHPGGAIGLNLSHLNYNLVGSCAVDSINLKNSFSSQVSSSSLLSLDQIRQNMKTIPNTRSISNPSSLTSSDDEDTADPKSLNIDYNLSSRVKLVNPAKILFINESKLNVINDAILFKWVVLYDFIIYELGHCQFAIDTDDVKSLIRIELGHHNDYGSEVWNKFIWKLKNSFKEIEI